MTKIELIQFLLEELKRTEEPKEEVEEPTCRDESLMKSAAQLLAAAGDYRDRRYLVIVDSGRAVKIEEWAPPFPQKMIVF